MMGESLQALAEYRESRVGVIGCMALVAEFHALWEGFFGAQLFPFEASHRRDSTHTLRTQLRFQFRLNP